MNQYLKNYSYLNNVEAYERPPQRRWRSIPFFIGAFIGMITVIILYSLF